MLRRIAEEGIGAMVVHKIDRRPTRLLMTSTCPRRSRFRSRAS
jgi:hypothetical protein